jgi:hypothetical protein
MTRRHQGDKMEKVHAQSKPAKIGLSGLGYQSISFGISDYLVFPV